MAETEEVVILDTRTGLEIPLPRIRWSSAGRLQQQWKTIAYEGREVVSADYEWRDVPTEQDLPTEQEP